ncbi:uncharacterized protein LOC142984545 [Anticarsia gemmatalis]|uniref:uncharacterized protein LOC142984545 n=1 Tax=Anticarsia gemmatalis TaxID=129554 RepID=UPI003F76C7AE
MNNKENSYCRLCAKIKPQQKLIDLQADEEKRHEIINNLVHLNIQLHFNENSLPKTVCLPCISTLQRSHDFVIAVERAQVVLNDIISSQSIKEENSGSESDNFVYEPPATLYVDDVPIKLKKEKVDESFEPPAVKKTKKSTANDEKNDEESPLTWKDYTWTCAYCCTEFPTVSELNSHSIQFHKCCNAYHCTDCNRRKQRLDAFITHVRRHRKHLKLSCHICFEVFKSPIERNKHIATHKTTEFRCHGCNTCLSTAEELTEHSNTYNRNLKARNIPVEAKDGLTCLICNKDFKTKMSLNTHLLTHTDRKRDHTCDICGKCFLNKQTLAGHFMFHNNERPFSCEICNASFRRKNQLKVHIGVHSGEKPFACEQCGRRFRLQDQLNSHRIIHTDSLPHVCSYCNKGFRFRTTLHQHIRQHTGVKPYSCDICQRDFTNWPNYNKHMKCRHNMNMAKRKPAPESSVVEPATSKEVYPAMDKILECKSVLEKKRGRPKLTVDVECTEVKSEDNISNSN